METATPYPSNTGQTTMGPGHEKNTFHAIDYVVFGVMLLISALIGVFFAMRDRRKAVLTTDAYLMASRKMSWGPVSMSLIASFMSSVTILGVPAEYYTYGTMFTWFAIVYALVPFLIGWAYMPVFYDLGISSTYEYLEKRFNKPTRMVTTFMYLILSILYGGIVVYGPALALSEVTGFDMWIAILSTGLVCIFYTTLGGLKAVIWTDVFQAIIMMTGFVAVIIQGSINLGGFGNIWKISVEGGRVDFMHFEFDPRIRHTFWSIMFGGAIFWLGINGVNQAQVQRYMCCKSKREAKIAIVWNAVGLVIILVLAGMTGLTIFATYHRCDPIDSGKIGKSDQLFPFIVMDILGYLPGVPGLFVAGIYSSSLSTLSSGMNAMACVTLEDFIKPYTRWRPSSYTLLSKILVLGYGVSFILFAYLASVVGGLIRMAYSIHGIISGPIVGLFTVGIFVPFVNAWGAFVGVVLGWTCTIWMFIGSVIYPTPPQFIRAMPRSTEDCSVFDNMANTSESPVYEAISNNSTSHFYDTTTYTSSYTTMEPGSSADRPAIADFYNLSYLYLAGAGCICTMLTAMLVSLFTGMTRDSPPSNDLLSPIFYEKRDDGKPPLERSSSWFSPTDLANAQRIINESDKAITKEPEQESLCRSPDVVSSIKGEAFVSEKESSF